MKRRKDGYTVKQYAYARRRLGGEGKTKKELALLSGYAPQVADNTKALIENTEGYANAVAALAAETGNVALKIYAEMKSRDLSKESVPVLMNAISVLASAWETFTPKEQKTPDGAGAQLRNIILQRIENQTITPKK